MKVAPKTDKEISEANLKKPGVYDFEIRQAEERMSKAGNEMIVLDLTVHDHELGNSIFIQDYLLDIPSMAYKLKHASEACNLLDDYLSGALDAMNFVGKSGQLELGIQSDKEGKYPDRNSVKDYLRPINQPSSKEQVEAELDDSIPF